MIEKELIEECRRGDLQNFRKIMEETTPMVFSVAFRMLGDEDTARDIVQDTMVTVWQNLQRIRSAEKYRTWVYRITINKCYDQLRKRKQLNETRYDDQAWALISNHISEDAITELENMENALIIDFLTNKLSHKQKAVFILSELEELPADVVSGIIGISRAAVKANLYYARNKIKSLLQKYL